MPRFTHKFAKYRYVRGELHPVLCPPEEAVVVIVLEEDQEESGLSHTIATFMGPEDYDDAVAFAEYKNQQFRY